MSEDSTVEQFLGLIFHTALVVMLLLFALNFSLKAAERGFFPHDQSIVLDGAHRIISGQIPYSDFLMPFGPMTFWAQAVFSRAFGLTHFSSLLSAAAANMLATLFSVLILRQLFPNRRHVSYLAGFVTAIWFAPPFGTLWMDHVAFLFSLFAILTTLYGLPREEDGRSSDLLFVLAGCSAFLAFVSKQNVGLFMLPVCPILLGLSLASNRQRALSSIGYYIVGVAGALAAFLVWLKIASSPSVFWEYSIRMAGRLGVERLFGSIVGLIGTLLFGRGPVFTRIVTTGFLILSVFVLIFHLRNRHQTGLSSPRLIIPPLLCICLALAQRLSILTSTNQAQNGFPLIGIILAAGTGILLYLFHSDNPTIKQLFDRLQPFTRRDIRTILVAAVLLSSLYVSISGINVSLNRDVQDSVTGSVYSGYMTHPKLLSLRWGNPTMVKDTDVTERNVMNILAYLSKSKKNFFIFPDFTIFYALSDVPSPQPLLYFAPGETYPPGGDSLLDRRVVDGLKENAVEIILLEEKSVTDSEQVLSDFPSLRSFIDENFVKIGKIGIFHIYRKPEYGWTEPAAKWDSPA
jgi:4-amino-4-deoxy-L-arabinose transferase-like glycosyltransferase